MYVCKAWEGCGERMKKATIELPRSANRGRRLMLPDSDCPFSSLKRLGMKGAEGGPAPPRNGRCILVLLCTSLASVPPYSKCDSALSGLAATRQTRYCRPAAMCRTPSGANLLMVSET